MKTQRMKSKDRYLGVLNMPDATEVGLQIRPILGLFWTSGGRR